MIWLALYVAACCFVNYSIGRSEEFKQATLESGRDVRQSQLYIIIRAPIMLPYTLLKIIFREAKRFILRVMSK